MPSFACPKCKKVLKTSAPIPAGKNVKCPGCAHVFTLPAAKTGIQANKPVAPARKVPAVTSDDDDDLPKKRRRPDPDDEDDAPRQPARKAKPRVEDDDPDEEDDDRPARRRKKKKAASNKGLFVILGGVGGLLLVLAIAAFLWPGFLVGKDKVAGNVKAGAPPAPQAPLDPLAFVPNNCDYILGANLAFLRTKPETMQQFEQALKQQNALNPVALDLVKNAERGIIAGLIGPTDNVVVAFSSVAVLDPQKVIQAFNAGPAETIQGKTVYKVAGRGAPGRELLAMPTDKMVVFGSMSEVDFVKILDARGALSPDMQAHVNGVNQKTGWGVVNVQAALKDKAGQLKALEAKPGGAQAMAAIKNAKTAAFSLDAANDTRLQIDVQFANDQDATTVEAFAKGYWEKEAKPALAMLPFMLGKQAGGALTNDINQTFKIQRQGSQVTASVTITENTSKELEKLQQAGPGGVNPRIPGKKK